jgi:hypothetical protein
LGPLNEWFLRARRRTRQAPLERQDGKPAERSEAHSHHQRPQGLGFMGIMVQGGHHQPHHLMMAKGEHPAN